MSFLTGVPVVGSYIFMLLLLKLFIPLANKPLLRVTSAETLAPIPVEKNSLGEPVFKSHILIRESSPPLARSPLPRIANELITPPLNVFFNEPSTVFQILIVESNELVAKSPFGKAANKIIFVA